jgi:hypothetical protein
MTSTKPNTAPDNQIKRARRRPLLLTLLSLFTWIYYGIMASLFFLALFYSGWITDVINQYIPDGSWTKTQVSLIFLCLFLCHGIAFAGIILLWNGQPAGYYLFSVPTILITLFHLFRPEISWISTAVYAILVILFGLFYRQMRFSSAENN